ncbi:hypothetical protein GOV13_02265 [Candidatus Pacearchaeota archaeon]|nr:hypothetical protein [Candidatus Pacearchaeota archaeon]
MLNDSAIYDANSRLMSKAEELGIPYNKILPRLEGLINNDNLSVTAFKILEECVIELISENIAQGKHFEGFQYLRRATDSLGGFSNEFVHERPPEEYLSALRKDQIDLAHELIKSRERAIENVFDVYNDFLEEWGIEGQKLSNKDLTLSNLYEYGLHPDLEFKKSDCGKCIIYFDDESGFRFSASKIEENIMPRDTSKEGLRDFFKEPLQRLVHYHRDNDKPYDSSILGGGAYFMKSPKTIFVDFKSGDFGMMNKGLVTKCLKDSGLKVQTFGDDQYFNTRELEHYLRNHFLNEPYPSEESSSTQEEPVYSGPPLPDREDDDIPF